MSVMLVIAGLAMAGCEAVGTAAQKKSVQGGLLGSALGAGAGAIIGNQTGRAGEGAAIGAGLGALGGALVGNAMEEQAQAAQSQATPVATGKTKFCPVGGELYGEDMKYCPNHGVELRYKDQP
ncbi:MAG: glycine zipper 2TM domain-containing protein [Candidatus Omnitrophica bacterium]|nr:glycine zipper 2TM domain-containing protein [Candidatus Omnitrophota bacterium]